jgi:hypothetical protein
VLVGCLVGGGELVELVVRGKGLDIGLDWVGCWCVGREYVVPLKKVDWKVEMQVWARM